MLKHRLLSSADLTAGLDAIVAALVRYPGLDATAFARRVRAFVEHRDG